MADHSHSRAAVSHDSTDTPIDRHPQYLPVPLGDLRPVRRRQRRHLLGRLWRRHLAETVAACGVLLAATAALLAISRPADSVYLEGDRVHVDGVTLVHPAGNAGVVAGRVYQGPATLVLIPFRGGAVTASAVTFIHGEKVTGVCRLDPPSSGEIAESCELRMGRTAIDCRDTMPLSTPGTWSRRCSDGKRLSITVPSGTAVVPMPFPLGET